MQQHNNYYYVYEVATYAGYNRPRNLVRLLRAHSIPFESMQAAELVKLGFESGPNSRPFRKSELVMHTSTIKDVYEITKRKPLLELIDEPTQDDQFDLQSMLDRLRSLQRDLTACQNYLLRCKQQHNNNNKFYSFEQVRQQFDLSKQQIGVLINLMDIRDNPDYVISVGNRRYLTELGYESVVNQLNSMKKKKLH